jgi:MFS family permease
MSAVTAGRSWQLALLTLAASAVAYGRTALSPLQETMGVALSLTDNQMALLQGPALALPVVLAAIPLGLLIDRYSRVHLLFVLAVLCAMGSVLTALAPNFAVLFLARCFSGLTATATSTTAISLLSDLYAPAQRGRASMTVTIGQYVGFSAAFALGGALLAMAGPAPNGWRTTMLWLSAPLGLIVFLLLGLREPPRTGRLIEAPSVPQSFSELWRYRAVIGPVMGGIIMAEIATLGALAWAAPTLSRNFALSPNRVGAIMAVVVLVSGILGSITGGILADFCQRTGGPRRTILTLSVLALLSVPVGLFGVVADVTASSVLLALFMTVVGAIIVMGTALFTIVIPNEVRGLCLAVSSGAAVIFGIALAPVAVSLLAGTLGGPVMIGKALTLVCAAAGLLGAATFAAGSRSFVR